MEGFGTRERRERPGSKGDGNREWRGLEPGGKEGRDPGVKGMGTGSGGVWNPRGEGGGETQE